MIRPLFCWRRFSSPTPLYHPLLVPLTPGIHRIVLPMSAIFHLNFRHRASGMGLQLSMIRCPSQKTSPFCVVPNNVLAMNCHCELLFGRYCHYERSEAISAWYCHVVSLPARQASEAEKGHTFFVWMSPIYGPM